jgi:crotonobetainyl-CoA:carnitine CoA-transferase CaiB-like acyl-CoA transferase
VASGFFYMFSRNKRSVALDTATPEGRAAARKLIATADVLIENFRPGLMKRFGLDYDSLKRDNPRLVYCSLKGFLPGPYENRTALDEVVQMMGGLAHMTGPPGKPMRAGASVNDIMGGMFGVIGIQAALMERARTGKGRHIQSALFENNVFLMGQAMMYHAVTGQPSPPWSVKDAPWPVYDLFDTADGAKIFLSVVGEEHWRGFCTEYGLAEWLADPSLATNQGRVDARPSTLPVIAEILRARTVAELSATFERIGLPFAPVNTPSDLFDDPHLNASQGLVAIAMNDGRPGRAPALPLAFDGKRLPKRLDPPMPGAHTAEVFHQLGFDDDAIAALSQPTKSRSAAE